MKILKKEIVMHNVYNFIDASINTVLMNNPSCLNIAADKKYWLFYFIKDNYRANMEYLNNLDIDNDSFGYIPIWRNTRNSIEAFYDLVNLSENEDYLYVLKYCHANGEEKKELKSKIKKDYMEYMYRYTFTILSKKKISVELFGFNESTLLNSIATKSNDYVHPSVFVDVIPMNDLNKKEEILRNLLKANIYMLKQSYYIFNKVFNQNYQVPLTCMNCNVFPKNCGECYRLTCLNFDQLMDSYLFVDMNQNLFPYNF